MAPGHGTHRHHPGIGHHCPGQTAGETALELLVSLQVTLATAVTREATSLPLQRQRTPRHRQVADAPEPGVVHPSAPEPAVRTARPRPGRADRHHQLVERVHHHGEHTDQAQMQADLHSVWSHGASCSRCVRHTEFSEAPAHAGGYLRRSHPTFTRSAHNYGVLAARSTR